MSKKMGRPKTPKGEAKTVLLGAFVNPPEAEVINRAIAESGQSKSEWIRSALKTAARPVWVICKKWSASDLHGKSVDVNLQTKDGGGVIRGIGKFWVIKHNDGVRLAIEIHGRDLIRHLRLFLDQKLADVIERHPEPSVADFHCFATIATLQRLG
jgi:hypothetical protein